jgi:hypothetical protein
VEVGDQATQDNAPLVAVVLAPVNEVIDLHSVHLAWQEDIYRFLS